MLSNPVSRFRVISIAEGCSFLVLLIFGSLLSRISDINLVMPLGILHAVFFIALVVVSLEMRTRLNWDARTTALALLAAVLPTGPFFFDYARRAELREAERSLAPEPAA